MNFLGNSHYRRTVINPAHKKKLGLIEMTLGLVHASCDLPKWQTDFLSTLKPQFSSITICK